MPLVASPCGSRASATFGLHPFIDGSIRREPDLEHPFPAISCLCRGSRFAPRLRPGDVVGYMTKKRRYGSTNPHRRLTAVLRVVAVFASHAEGSQWYRDQNLRLPSNCLVAGNAAVSLEMSHQLHEDRGTLADDRLARRWDVQYQLRAKEMPTFVVCTSLFSNLSWRAPIVLDTDLEHTFGKIPGTQNPGRLSCVDFNKLLARLDIPELLSAP
jgi:hypothetical protein